MPQPTLEVGVDAPDALDVRSFPARASPSPVLWPLLTPARSADPLEPGYPALSFLSAGRTRQASPGKSAVFPSIYRPIYSWQPHDKGLRPGTRAHPTATSLAWGSGPPAGGLLLASFGFRLATDTLALS